MMSIKEILLSLTAIIFVTLFPHFDIIPIPFGYSILILIFVWFFLKYFKENFEHIGFSIKNLTIKTVLFAALAGVFIFYFLEYALFPLLEKLVQLPPSDLGDFAKIKGNTGFYIFILIMGWVVGGFYEELVFHGFIFTRFEKMIPGKHTIRISFLLTNTIFAFYHFQLGSIGIINAFMAGSAYHLLMLFNKRNMWYSIICHAVFDTIALTYLYVGNG